MKDYTQFFNKDTESVDRDVAELIRYESLRQHEKIILIPSESIAPLPVRMALASPFTNIYAEGYPARDLQLEDDESILEYDRIIPYYRRYSNRRFYRGCDYVDFIETLAQKRAAKLFATDLYSEKDIYANVQPLSGAAANTAVYDAFVKPGDTVMGMSLMHGGHLTHGSEFNRSGKNYRIVSYEVDPKTEKLNYDQIYDLAQQYRPKMIIAGYTSYPWTPDWEKFREIADSVGAILFADISHPAGLVVAGVYPNPVGYADVITFTTHKTMFGPRGAVILTTNPDYAELIDQAVFPGEQGGPHVNKFAAMAVAFKIAESDAFKETQKKIVENAKYLASKIEKNGIRLAYGGTDTHLFLLDLKSIKSSDRFTLKGEVAVRILDFCGIVANKNTIPGDTVTAEATGIRMGTPWITQRGINKEGLDGLADIISYILKNIEPFEYAGLTGTLPRGKIRRKIITECNRSILENIINNLGSEYSDSDRKKTTGSFIKIDLHKDYGEKSVIVVEDGRSLQLLEESSTVEISTLNEGEVRETLFFDEDYQLVAHTHIMKLNLGKRWDSYILFVNSDNVKNLYYWLQGLSDGYIKFNKEDVFMKIEGPAIVRRFSELDPGARSAIIDQAKSKGIPEERDTRFTCGEDITEVYKKFPDFFNLSKPYFVGHEALKQEALKIYRNDKKVFEYEEKSGESKPSALYEEHRKLGAVMVDFAGWKMPVRYESIIDEHRNVREKAGLFDISHMGVFEVSGDFATLFLDTVTTNYADWLKVGDSQYSYLLDPDGNVIDDIMVYRVEKERYIVVVNAANEDKDFEWLNGVNEGRYILDRNYPYKEVIQRVSIVNLKSPEAGERAKVNIAIQGPESLNILRKLVAGEREKIILNKIKKTQFAELSLGGIRTIVARTGYTGESVGYELLVHPDKAPELWNKLLEEGEDFGLKPIGLGARDSLRTEAGLPLYGHELAGPYNITPVEAGFTPYVKLHKPFFIGREAIKERILNKKMVIARYQMDEKGVKMIKPGDIVVNRKNSQVIGCVTSNAVNGEGIQVGLALIDKKSAVEGNKIALVPVPAKKENLKIDLDNLKAGIRFPLGVSATIVSRFLNR